MCGLMAGSGKLEAGAITALCCMNVTRGKDSAGVAWVEGKRAAIAKVAEHPLSAFNTTLRGSIIKASKSGAMIGHTRAATQGSVSSKNAHPYLEGSIAWAHNGVIQNDEDFGKYDVDSQALIHGIKKRDFSKFVGSIALVWLENGKLCAYRKGNPLYRGRKGQGLYLASERVFLERVGCKHIQELIEGKLYTFKGPEVESAQRIPENRVYAVSRPEPEIETAYSIDYSNWPDAGQTVTVPTMDLSALNEDTPPIG